LLNWTVGAVNIQPTHSNAVTSQSVRGGSFFVRVVDDGTSVLSTGSLGIQAIGSLSYNFYLNQTRNFNLHAVLTNGTIGAGSIWGSQVDTYINNSLVDSHFTQAATNTYNYPFSLNFTGVTILVRFEITATVYCEFPNNHFASVTGSISEV